MGFTDTSLSAKKGESLDVCIRRVVAIPKGMEFPCEASAGPWVLRVQPSRATVGLKIGRMVMGGGMLEDSGDGELTDRTGLGGIWDVFLAWRAPH